MVEISNLDGVSLIGYCVCLCSNSMVSCRKGSIKGAVQQIGKLTKLKKVVSYSQIFAFVMIFLRK